MMLEWKRRLGNGGSAVGEQNGEDGALGWELQGELMQQVDKVWPWEETWGLMSDSYHGSFPQGFYGT